MRASTRTRISIGIALASLAGAAALSPLPGCGDSTGLAIATLGVSAIAGTAAQGAPIANATVTIRGSAGGAAVATTDASGTYTADVSGLTPPFLLRVDSPAGVTPFSLFSVATATGVVNIHPFTHLIIDTYYEAQGLSLTTEFDRPGGPSLVPAPSEVRTIAQVIRRVIARWLTAQGLESGDFDLISTPFDADGSGFDAVLDQTRLSDGRQVQITDGTTTQNSTVTASGSAARVETATEAGGDTSVADEALALAPPGQQDALGKAIEEVVSTFFEPLVQTITARGQSLAKADVIGFFDPGFLNGGEDADTSADNLAQTFAGAQLTLLGVDRIVSFRPADQIIELVFTIALTAGGSTTRERIETEDGGGFLFRKAPDGKWKILGDGRLFGTQVTLTVEKQYVLQPQPATVVALQLRPSLRARIGTVQSVTVTGIFPPTPTAQTLALTNVQSRGGGLEEFSVPFSHPPVPFPPPPGSVYTFGIRPTVGATVTLTARVRGGTAETIDILKYNGNDRALFKLVRPDSSDFAGFRVTVQWTRPRTFPVQRVELFAVFTKNGSPGEMIESDTRLPPGATMGTLTFPLANIQNLEIAVFVRGENGEVTEVRDEFN